LSLRNDADAQLEIREYASKIEKLFADALPFTYDSWIQNGRTAI
jgi:thymidylate synthase ThyX